MEPQPVVAALPKLASGIKEPTDRAVAFAHVGRFDMAADCLGDAAAIARWLPTAIRVDCDSTGEDLDPEH